MNKGNKVNHDSSWYLIKRLYTEHIHHYRQKFLAVIFLMFVAAITTAINAWLMQPVLDSIFFNKELTMLYIVPTFVVINSIVKGGAHFYQLSTMKKLGQKIVNDLQIRLYSHLIYADTKLLMEYPSGNLISRMTNDINAMRKSVSDLLTGAVQELCTLIGLVFLMFYQSKSLALIAVFIIPVAFYPMLKLGHKMRRVARKIQEGLSSFTVRLDETFQHISLVKSYCREEYEISRAKKVIDNVLSLYKKSAYIESAPSPMMEVLSSVAIAFIIWYGGSEVIDSKMSPGEFFSFITALIVTYKPLKSVTQLNTSLQEALSAAKRMFSLLDEKPTIFDDPRTPHSALKNFNIEFHDIHFSYKTGLKILDGFNLRIQEGTTVALVGSSGVGKTTVLQLLQRLYDPESGYITIGGQNITKMRLNDLRNEIALVSQEIALFDETIMDNIRYGKLEATQEEIVEAAVAAAAHDFIINLPEGYNTLIGQRGVKLSGGQRQRLAIARAMLKNSPVLLLDEATSALDSIAEKQVQEALDRLKKGRTTIVIAHRLSSIEGADMICVIANGRVAEYGSHQELISLNREYCKFYNQYKNITGMN
ncbi:MAG: ABC-type multidrug transport system, ATPase and permease component [Candidatus Midichloria mitochondrii]|nr:ABC transporter ATP-binding protein/permease [Candidatus Midichloria mitochondrii]MDJ1287692.1 ABC transporter ATP-binding protein/permease [Candidatus Midichloria mitochondrii]MDJ1298554.1 ABC transporter ATP-binding protein/permease [Candidatus Midichloria mitochondrii]MDJ1583274.1 ABC transporter ATP-binding protein/permease [Candidatus Midichloria mitochondrii]